MDELERTMMTIGCRDADHLPKVPQAGWVLDESDGTVQIMHNGIKVRAGGYHGDWMAHIIRSLRGHHEPQEEAVFAALLRFVRHASVMVELGSFWAYYSCWFLHEIPGSTAICVEPDAKNLELGKANIALNGFATRTTFHQAWAGRSSSEQVGRTESTGQSVALPSIGPESLLTIASGRPIELLHLDVQGGEDPFLDELASVDLSCAVRFVIVSTHHQSISGSPTTHADSIARLLDAGACILIEHDVFESYSGDGLVVASFRPGDRDLDLPIISRNDRARSLFPS
jgi:FkbM family methyltransferase